MTRKNNSKRNWIIAIVAIIFVILALFLGVRKAGATATNAHDYLVYNWSDWSKCKPNRECTKEGGTVGGTQTRTETTTCEHLPQYTYASNCSKVGEVTVVDTQTQKCEVEVPACKVDQCRNLSGFQEVVPTGMQTNEDHVCSCAPGYHEPVQTEGQGPKFDFQQSDFTCVPDEPSPTPEATPEATPTTEQGLTPAGAPICGDGSIVSLPIDFHVVRSGSDATLIWYKNGGDLVNIYYKEVGQANWTHAVGDVPNVDPINNYVIHALVPATGYIFAIEQHNGCGGGQLVQSVVVDGPSYLPVLWQFSYWQWSE